MEELFKCPNFNCGAEFKGVAPSRDPQTSGRSPTCVCGTVMRRWPETALKTDKFEDV